MPPLLAPVMIEPLSISSFSSNEKDQGLSFLSLDSPTSVCDSSLSMRESRRTSCTSNSAQVEPEEDGEQYAICKRIPFSRGDSS